MAGATLLSDAVASTLGPSGRNVVIQGHPNRPPHVTKDGVTVARSIMSNDPLERAAIMLIRQVANKTAEAAGDGTTTATVLAKAILDEGVALVENGANAVQLQRGISHGAKLIIEQLRQMSTPVSSEQDLMRIATISANSDTEIGAVICEAIERVTASGLITIEEANDVSTKVITHKGYAVDSGYLDPVFSVLKGEMRQKISYQDAAVIVTDQSISRLTALVPVLDTILNEGRPIVMFVANMMDEALRMLVENHLSGAARILVVRVVGLGDDVANTFTDIAALVGGKVLSANLHSLPPDELKKAVGRARSIEASRDRTIICPMTGENTPDALINRVAFLQAQSTNGESEWSKGAACERLQKLSSRVAVVQVGGVSETVIKEKMDRFDDALHATRAASETGIIPGGGISLIRAAANVIIPTDPLSVQSTHEDFLTGVRLIVRAASAPFLQIASNAGTGSPEAIDMLTDISRREVGLASNDFAPLRYDLAGTNGVDFMTGSVVNMLETGIIDPVKVTETAVHCAAEIAGLLITTEFLMAPIPD